MAYGARVHVRFEAPFLFRYLAVSFKSRRVDQLKVFFDKNDKTNEENSFLLRYTEEIKSNFLN